MPASGCSRRAVLWRAAQERAGLWAVLNNDPEMKELVAKCGFELINVGIEGMDKFMAEKIRVYTGAAKQMGIGK